MSEGVLNGSGGSIPIRGLVRFDENTPDDFTTEDGARFLRRGVVETDIAKFDTEIWNDILPVKVNEEDMTWSKYKGHKMGYKAHGCTSNAGVTIIPNILDTPESNVLISDGNGKNFKLSTSELPRLHPDMPSVFSANTFVIVAFVSTSVIISSDDFETFSEVEVGIPIEGILADNTAIVVWAVSGLAKRSTDGGRTWANIASLTSKAFIPAIKENVWALIDDNKTYLSINSGASWVEHTNNYDGGFSANVTKLFADSNKFYGILNSRDLITSTDGILWSEPTALLGNPPTGIYTVAHANGVFVSIQNSAPTFYLSKDAITWKPYFRNSIFNGHSSFDKSGFAPTNNGIILGMAGYYIDTVELSNFAGSASIYDYQYLQYNGSSSVFSEYSECDFVRIS